MSEKRPYTTIAISKETYSMVLVVRHELEKKQGKSMSYNDVIRSLCKRWGCADGE